MNKIAGIPRNAAIALFGVLISAGALALALLIPWGSSNTPPTTSAPSAGTQPLASSRPAILDTRSFTPPDPLKPEPARITLNFDNLPADQALQALAAEASLDASFLGVVPTRDLPISMHLRDAPLIAAVLEFCRLTRTTPNEWTMQRLTLRPSQDPSSGRWSISGPFATGIMKIEYAANVSLTGASERSPPVISLVLLAEPSVRVMRFMNVTFQEFRDEKGQTIGPSVYESSVMVTPQIQRANSSRPLVLPLSPGEKIAILKGSATALVASRVEKLETTGPEETLTRTLDGVKITIPPLRLGGPNARATAGSTPAFNSQVTLTRAGIDDAAWDRLSNQGNRFEIAAYSLNNERLASSVFIGPKNNEMVMLTLSVRPNPNVADPHHIRLDLPMEYLEIPFSFEFKDLILP